MNNVTLTPNQVKEIENILTVFQERKEKIEEIMGGIYIEIDPSPMDILYIIHSEKE